MLNFLVTLYVILLLLRPNEFVPALQSFATSRMNPNVRARAKSRRKLSGRPS